MASHYLPPGQRLSRDEILATAEMLEEVKQVSIRICFTNSFTPSPDAFK